MLGTNVGADADGRTGPHAVLPADRIEAHQPAAVARNVLLMQTTESNSHEKGHDYLDALLGQYPRYKPLRFCRVDREWPISRVF
jgi:hypothetical protein